MKTWLLVPLLLLALLVGSDAQTSDQEPGLTVESPLGKTSVGALGVVANDVVLTNATVGQHLMSAKEELKETLAGLKEAQTTLKASVDAIRASVDAFSSAMTNMWTANINSFNAVAEPRLPCHPGNTFRLQPTGQPTVQVTVTAQYRMRIWITADGPGDKVFDVCVPYYQDVSAQHNVGYCGYSKLMLITKIHVMHANTIHGFHILRTSDNKIVIGQTWCWVWDIVGGLTELGEPGAIRAVEFTTS